MTSLPNDAAERKRIPLATGVLDYFPDALAAVATVSRLGNDQHNPGQPLHWAKEKSTDHADCIMRHLMERGTIDSDGALHSAKLAWRALALLQTELEEQTTGGVDQANQVGTNHTADAMRRFARLKAQNHTPLNLKQQEVFEGTHAAWCDNPEDHAAAIHYR